MIAGPQSYSKIKNWEKALPDRAGMFLRSERRTIAGEIQHKHKKPETCSPGIGKYNPEAWRAEKVTRIKGHYGKTEERVTTIDDYVSIHGDVPLAKYETLPLDKQLTKPRYTVIETKLQRWSPGGSRDNSPSAASYEVAESIEKSQWPKKKEHKFNAKDRVSPFKEIVDKATW